jgi:hypothetical protein
MVCRMSDYMYLANSGYAAVETASVDEQNWQRCQVQVRKVNAQIALSAASEPALQERVSVDTRIGDANLSRSGL